ncbi:MAG TPA: hypothetical protein VMZ91_04410 [Candidatus Paceibacterota bacterium]|nr:hypothetical protein [Candidatus Paceibacterota bacterium]
MTKELEDLEKQFILNEDMELEDIKGFVARILKFCKIDSKVFVIIQRSKLRIVDKLLLILSARYLANKLQQKLGKEPGIAEIVNIKDLASMMKEKETVIIARLKDLKDGKKVISQERGVYKVAPYAIKDFLTELEGVKNE